MEFGRKVVGIPKKELPPHLDMSAWVLRMAGVRFWYHGCGLVMRGWAFGFEVTDADVKCMAKGLGLESHGGWDPEHQVAGKDLGLWV